MAEPLNLNKARKAGQKLQSQAAAAENRIKYGRTKAEKMAARAETERARRALDQNRREP